MYETVTTPRGPNPIETFKAAPGPTIARWIERKARRKRELERFGDLQRHPWRGERQAGKARGIYANNVRTVDAELRAVPYEERMRNPPSGAYPLVMGLEVGTGPHPWFDATDSRLLGAPRGRRDAEYHVGPARIRTTNSNDKPTPTRTLPVDKDWADYPTGPAADPPPRAPLDAGNAAGERRGPRFTPYSGPLHGTARTTPGPTQVRRSGNAGEPAWSRAVNAVAGPVRRFGRAVANEGAGHVGRALGGPLGEHFARDLLGTVVG